MTKTITTIALLLGFASTANAQCRQSQVCDDYGQRCRIVQICRNAIDMPDYINPPQAPQIPRYEMKPLPSFEMPPLGTTECKYMLVNGRWQSVCQ